MDGTFKTSPSIFGQVYTIHGFIGTKETGKVFPLVYSLMTNKSEELYRCFLKEIDTALGNRERKTEVIITDFEKAAMNAVDKELNVDYGGCYFHLKKSFLKKANKFGFNKLIGTNMELQRLYKLMCALPFLPPNEIPSAFDILVGSIGTDYQEAKDFIKYVETYYIRGTATRLYQVPPKFPPVFWSVYSRTELGLPRTQNSVESWHNRLNILVGTSHPNVFKLVEEFRKEEHSTTAEIIRQELSGGSQSKRRKDYLEKEATLLSLFQERDSMPVLVYLEKVARRLKLGLDLYQP